VGITHFDEAPVREVDIGHIRARWTDLGRGAGSDTVGGRRIQIPAGGWSTPAHEHGREEELFYVLGGRGISWQAGRTAEIGPRDSIVYHAHGGAHTLHALEDLDVLAFGPRVHDESLGFPRLGLSLVGSRAVASLPYAIDGAPIQFIREAEAGPPELPEPGPRPDTIVNLDDVEPRAIERERIARARRDLGTAVGSRQTGLVHVVVPAGKQSVPLHCHSLEEELFVILDGEGVLLLGDEEAPVRPGSVVARPAATGVAHAFRAGEAGLTYLAYGPREPGDLCYYPHSNKISFRGVRLIGRIERLDYWDGED
jgi:uncharacterized cupin superfamily protein